MDRHCILNSVIELTAVGCSVGLENGERVGSWLGGFDGSWNTAKKCENMTFGMS